MVRINTLVLAAAFSICADGAVLISNLAEPTIPGANDTDISMNLWAWQSFQTDNNSYNLIDIQTVLGNSTAGAGVVAQLRVYDTGTLLTTPVSASTPASAMMPTHTATLKLYPSR